MQVVDRLGMKVTRPVEGGGWQRVYGATASPAEWWSQATRGEGGCGALIVPGTMASVQVT